MKTLKRYIFLTLLMVGLLFSLGSCSKTELDIFDSVDAQSNTKALYISSDSTKDDTDNTSTSTDSNTDEDDFVTDDEDDDEEEEEARD